MARRNANKYLNLKKIILGVLLLILGVWLTNVGYAKPNLSWERLFWLCGSLFVASAGLALTMTKDMFWANTCRIFVGMVFVYSGFVKIVDPLGSTYKFTDYFEAWHIGFMEPYALPLAVFMSLAELVVGFAVVLNCFMWLSSYGALIFMVYFTPVTLYLAFQEQASGKELVHDCGCFGDSLILSNWQTFVKNIILLVPTLVFFAKRTRFESIFLGKIQAVVVSIAIIFGLGIAYWGLEHLPIIDFRPYKIGSNIPEKMAIPPGAPQPKYDTFLYYKNKKTGEQKEFTLQNYPQDTTWEFVDTKNILVEEGYVPAIHDFSISNTKEGDITDIVLQDKNYNFLLVCYNINKTETDDFGKINKLYAWCQQSGLGFRCLTSSVENEVASFVKKTGAQFSFYNTDAVTLKTIVRANPGLVVLKNGTVVAMWHHNDIPDVAYFKKLTGK